MSNLKVGPAGQLYDPVTGAYVGHLDADGTERAVVTYTTRPDGWVGSLSAGVAIAPQSRPIAFIGDSRIEGVWYKWGIAVSDPSGVPTNGLYINYQGAQSDATLGGVGNFQYSADLDAYRWTAPADTPGEWIPAVVGAVYLPSGSANAGLYITVWRKPTVTASQAVTLAATRVNHNSGWFLNRHGLLPYVLSEFPDVAYARLGAGGSKLEDGVSMLPWYAREASGPGFDVFWYGTNDINSTTGLAGMLENAKAILDARLATGRRIAIIGEHARWGTAVNAPLTAPQQAVLRAYNDWLAAYVAANSSQTRYVDALSRTADPAYTDCRPITGIAGRHDMLYDVVHPTLGAALAIAPRVVAALKSLGLEQTRTPLRGGDRGVMTFGGTSLFTAAAGTAGANVTTTDGVPTGVTAMTSAATVTAAVDLVPSSIAAPAGAIKLAYAATDSVTAYARAYTGTTTLAAAGWAVGDKVKFAAIVNIQRCDPADVFFVKYTFTGLTAPRACGVELTPGSAPGEYWLESPDVVIPPGVTGVMWEVRVTPKGTGTVKGAVTFEGLFGLKVS